MIVSASLYVHVGVRPSPRAATTALPATVRRPRATVIAPDLPGHARSTRLRRYDPDEIVADLAGLVDHLGIRRAPIVVGHASAAALAERFGASYATDAVVTEASWGRYWGWDPKEVWAFISWVIYAAYLHARATPSVKRPIVGWIAVLGGLSMLVNLFGVNLFLGGFHSYTGVK